MPRSIPVLLAALTILAASNSALADARPAPTTRASLVTARAASHESRAARTERARIRAELSARRELNLSRFQAYVARGVYPVNTYEPGMLNIFIDEGGRICAAATIMTADGHGDLVRQVAAQDNFLRLGTVTEGPLLDWIRTSGFTQEEIAMIQEPFWEPEPTPGPSPHADSAREEHDRLAARYAVIVRTLRSNERRSLTTATDRLMSDAAS